MYFKTFLEDTTELPSVVVEAFTKLAHQQRGEPEIAMGKAQTVLGGGVYGFVIEHTGDLIHRMTEMAKYNRDGREYIIEKTEKVLRVLKSPYGFMKEHKENLKHNAEYHKVSLADLETRFDKALKRYEEAHQALPVYNDMQWLAKRSAVLLGQQKPMNAIDMLEILNRNAQDKENWHRKAFAYKLDNAGKILEKKPGDVS